MKPKINVKFKNNSFTVFEILGKKGDVLAKHQVNNDALLQILNGKVIYKEVDTQLGLLENDMHSIPRSVIHELEFAEASKLYLFLKVDTKIKFDKSEE